MEVGSTDRVMHVESLCWDIDVEVPYSPLDKLPGNPHYRVSPHFQQHSPGNILLLGPLQ